MLTASATCKPESRRNLKPTKPAIEISDADRKRKILPVITDKCTMALKKWREKGEYEQYTEYPCSLSTAAAVLTTGLHSE